MAFLVQVVFASSLEALKADTSLYWTPARFASGRPDSVSDMISLLSDMDKVWPKGANLRGVSAHLLPLPQKEKSPKVVPPEGLLLVELDDVMQLSDSLSEFGGIKGNNELEALFSGGLVSGARIVVLLPQLVTGGSGVDQDVTGGSELNRVLNDMTRVMKKMNHQLITLVKNDAMTSLSDVLPSPTKGSLSDPSPHTRKITPLLKTRAIDFYGLKDASTNKVRLMTGELVQQKDAIFSHIWASRNITKTKVNKMHKLFNLPSDFYDDCRNFLILPKDLEHAFDEGLVLILPKKGVNGSPPSAVCRVLDPEQMGTYGKYNGLELIFPKAAEGRVPFMRLLGWHALAMLANLYYEEYHSVEKVQGLLDLDASITADSHKPLQTQAGLLFVGQMTATDDEKVPGDEEDSKESDNDSDNVE